MKFGCWEESVHESSDQQKRLNSARLAATSPLSVDAENQCAVFKSSGQNPYNTTLNSCTCVDFFRRKLPCKHIYRLAMEIGSISAEYKEGKNKNEFKANIFALPVESQEMLYDICYFSSGRRGSQQKTIFPYLRDSFSVNLISNGYCVEIPFDTHALDLLEVSEIKNMIFPFNFDGCPIKKGSHKKTVLSWISDNESTVFPAISSKYILLKISDQANEVKGSICSRFRKKFIIEDVEVEPGTQIYIQRETKVFTQEST